MAILRKYGVADTVRFSLYTADGTELYSTALTSGDCKISLDGGALADLTPTVVNGVYELGLSIAQLQAKTVDVFVVDQDVTKAFMDLHFTIETYGDANAQRVSIDQTGDGYAQGVTNEGKIDAVIVDTTSIESKIDIVDANVDLVLEDTGTTLPSQISTVQTTVDGTDTTVNTISTTVGTINTTTTTTDGKVDSLSSGLAVVDSNVDAILVDTGVTLPSQIAGVESKVDVVDAVVDSVKVDTTAILVDTGTTLQNQLNTVESKIDTVDTNVDTINTATAGHTTTLSTINSKVDIVDSNVDSILAKMPTGSISELDLTTVVESGLTMGDVLSLCASFVSGRRLVDTATGTVTFYARDNSTILGQIVVSETEITRV